MKIVLLLSLLYTFVIANQTQLVLGSFLNERNAKKHVENINNFIDKDLEFKTFFQSNSLTSSYKKDGKYFSVVIKPFNDSDTQKRVLKYLKPRFKGAYAILLPKTKKTILQKKVITQQAIVQATLIKKPTTINESNISKVKSKIAITKPKISKNENVNTINKAYLLLIFILFLIVYFLRKKLQIKEDPALKTIIIDTPPLREEILNKTPNKLQNQENNIAVDVSDITLKPLSK